LFAVCDYFFITVEFHYIHLKSRRCTDITLLKICPLFLSNHTLHSELQ